jgi:hypothetical protein
MDGAFCNYFQRTVNNACILMIAQSGANVIISQQLTVMKT